MTSSNYLYYLNDFKEDRENFTIQKILLNNVGVWLYKVNHLGPPDAPKKVLKSGALKPCSAIIFAAVLPAYISIMVILNYFSAITLNIYSIKHSA
ncbi:hypothetical protein AMS58_03770 [Pseudoalteromonas porphyrae]|nr:hypothetical protein AMS58_03770 [Pseudoalteromonas porphyrae]